MEKKKGTKTLSKKATKVEKEQIVEVEQEVETVEIEVKEEVKPKKPAKKSKQQLSVELNTRTDEVLVEILNIGTSRTIYMNKFNDTYFDIEPGERETLTLKQLKV